MNGQTHRFYISRVLLIFSSILLASLFAFSTQAFAVNFTVNVTTDERDANAGDGICDFDLMTMGEQCSLRAAVEQSNSLNSNDRILFNLPASSTISLMLSGSGEEITITRNKTLEIIGTGANNLTINGSAGFRRIFYVNFGSVVSISALTLTGGNGMGDNFSGGGAIFVYEGSLTLDRVHITGNTSPSMGGGVTFQGGTHRITNSTISNNIGNGCGGFTSAGGTVIVLNSTISGNRTAGNGGGGGICTNGNDSNIILRNVSITGNTAHEGGGIYLRTYAVEKIFDKN